MEKYHYTECGLDCVYLINGFTRHETDYGPGISFQNVSELHKVITRYIITAPHGIRGQEVRFLRGELDISQNDLGKLMGLEKLQILRYENKPDEAIPGTSDRVLRVIMAHHLEENELLTRVLDLFREIDDLELKNVEFESLGEGWEKITA